jgi:uncharacterized protein YndB with AHSA1/START domain
MADREQRTEGGRSTAMGDREHAVRREAVLDASPSEVWEALTDERLLVEWLATDAELDPVPGGKASFRFANGERRDGTVLDVDEGRSLAFSWSREDGSTSVVRFSLEHAVDGTRLVVVERGPAAATELAGPEWARRLRAFVDAVSLVAA